MPEFDAARDGPPANPSCMVRPEDDFVRWRSAADVDALARVYDHAAPALLRLALHHVRHPATAEDLVQSTFLAAIDGAARYDAGRPLLGWLVGILLNQAKRLQRREGRTIEPGRVPDRAPDDPFAAANAAEFTAQVDEAIAGLPEVYRPVLRLHLAHEMTAAEIAHVLDRPPGTVRSQITRGLELVRAALPAGIALGAFAVLTPGVGLASARDVVLAAGKAHAVNAAVATAIATKTLGGVIVKKSVLGVVAALGLAASAWVLLAGSAGAALDRPDAAARPLAAMAARDTDAARASTDPDEPVRAVAVPSPAAAGWRLLGTVSMPNGEPAADADVRVLVGFATVPEALAEARVRRDGRYAVDLEPLRTLAPIDLDRAELALAVVHPGHFAKGDATAAGHTQVSVALPHRDPAQALTLVQDLQLVPAAVVMGRVVDARGSPVAGAWVVLLAAAASTDQRVANTEKEAPGSSNLVRVTLVDEHTARGRDEVGGAEVVRAAPASTGQRVADTRTDTLGRFRLAHNASCAGTIVAEHSAHGRGEVRCELGIGVDRTLPDVVLQPVGNLRARVIFADGEPAAGVGVGVYEPGNDSRTVATAMVDRLGEVAVRTLPPGRYRLCVGCQGGAPLPEPVVGTDEAPATIVLAGAHLLRFAYEDERGRALRPMDVGYEIWRAGNDAAAAFAAGGQWSQELEATSIRGWGGWSSVLVGSGTWIRARASHRDAFAEVMLQVAPPRNVIDATLVLRERQRDAVLRLKLTGPDATGPGQVQLLLHQLFLGTPGSYDLDPEPVGDELVLRWHAGVYRLEVKPKMTAGDLGWFAPFERQVELRAGSETSLAAAVPIGGRVRLHLHVPDSAGRAPIADFTVATPAAANAPRRPTFVEATKDGGWHFHASASPEVPLLWPPVLPVGSHTLAVRSRDHAEQEVGCVVSARAVTDLHIWLQPR